VSSPPAGTTPGKVCFNYTCSALADILYIYPNKRKKKSFENNRDEILRNGLDQALSGRNNDGGKTGRNGKSKFDVSPSKGSQDKTDEKFMRSKRSQYNVK